MADEVSGPTEAPKVSRQGQGGGRPPFEPTQADFDKVAMLFAMAWTNERVASALGISQPTFRKYFAAQIKERAEARDRVEGERLASLYQAAKAGRITAIRELGRVLGSDEPDYEKAEAKDPLAPKPARKGKKEEDRLAALEAEAELEERYGEGTRH